MTREEFIEKIQTLLPGADSAQTAVWADWLKAQDVSYETMHNAFFGVHQQYGGELAGLLYIKGPRHYCLYPNEFMLAAEYLYQGAAIEQIDERPTHTEQEHQGHLMSMCQGG